MFSLSSKRLASKVLLCSLFSALVLKTTSAFALDKVEVQVNDMPGVIVLSTQEYLRQNVTEDRLGKKTDITQLFSQGSNDLKIRAFNNTGNTETVSLSIYVNDLLFQTINCSSDGGSCQGDAGVNSSQLPAAEPWQDVTAKWDLFMDRTLTITTNDLPPARSVSIAHNNLNANETGYIYINNVYTGHQINDNFDFQLPQGNYTIAVGAFSESLAVFDGFTLNGSTPVSGQLSLPEYNGRYFESAVSVNSATQSIDLSSVPPLNTPNVVNVHVIPVKNTRLLDSSGNLVGTATLDESIITPFIDSLEAASEDFLEPISYGLMKWEVSLEPLQVSTPVDHNGGIDTERYLRDSGLTHLDIEHDVVIILYHDPNGAGAAALHGRIFSQQNFSARAPTAKDSSGYPILTRNQSSPQNERALPSEGILHEFLHVVEQWNFDRNKQWNGIDGLHGAEEHGHRVHPQGTSPKDVRGWMNWYVRFIQGRVIEQNSMFNTQTPSTPPSTCVSDCLYTGVFNSIREGVGNLRQAEEGTYALRNKWWNGEHYLNDALDVTRITNPNPVSLNDLQWVVEKEFDGQEPIYYLRPADEESLYLKLINSSSPALSLGAKDSSAQWSFVGAVKDFRLKNRASGHFINMEGTGSTPPPLRLDTLTDEPSLLGWWSGIWIFDLMEPATTESAQGVLMYAVNTGGNAYLGSNGISYQADAYFSGGSSASTQDSIAETSDDTLYRSERWGTFSYNFPVPNGTYEIELNLAEIYWNATNQRVFNVNIENSPAVQNLDLVQSYGHDVATTKLVSGVEVNDGELNINFNANVDAAKISAIVVRQISESSTPLNTIDIRMRGTSGSENVVLKVGGATIGTWTLSNSMATYSVTTQATGSIRVEFTNDASGRDVQVDYIRVNGDTRQAEQQNDNTGAWGNNRCGGGTHSEWLHCNGSIGFGNL